MDNTTLLDQMLVWRWWTRHHLRITCQTNVDTAINIAGSNGCARSYIKARS
jgi:hypothetical protein